MPVATSKATATDESERNARDDACRATAGCQAECDAAREGSGDRPGRQLHGTLRNRTSVSI
jgi:hypothetical protein